MTEPQPIASVTIERDADLVFARQRARDVAELIGLSDAARARFSTAVSEVARRALRHGGSVAVFGYASAPGPALFARMSYARAPIDAGPESLLPSSRLPSDPLGAPISQRAPMSGSAGPPQDWLHVAAMLVDGFEVDEQDEKTRISISMRLPFERMPLPVEEIRAIREALSRRTPADALVELQRQNRELLDALERVGRAERIAARAARERQTLLALIPDVVWTARPDGARDYLSPRWRELTGLSDRQSEGDGWLSAVTPAERAAVEAAYGAAIARGEPFDLELRLRQLDGTYRWHLMRGVPLSEQGKVVKWFGSSTDIDDGKRREQEAARVANYHKRMVSVVGHDLRAPLSVVMAAANMIETTSDGAVRLRMIARMKASVERAGRMIGDLLDYTRVELGGGLPVERRPCDIAHAIGALVEQARLAHPEHRFAVEGAGTATGEFDEDRVVQAISNLLENAAAHTAPGEPISVALDGDADWLRIRVRNRGPLVAPELLAQLFEPFRRAEPAGSGRGLGLGLYIVAEIAKSHGGNASMTSAERDGTVVELLLRRSA